MKNYYIEMTEKEIQFIQNGVFFKPPFKFDSTQNKFVENIPQKPTGGLYIGVPNSKGNYNVSLLKAGEKVVVSNVPECVQVEDC